MANLSGKECSPSLHSTKQVVVDLVPWLLMLLRPHSNINTHLALSDMSVGMGAAIPNRISDALQRPGGSTPPKTYYSNGDNMVDFIQIKISEMFLNKVLVESLDAQCWKLVTSVTNITADHVHAMCLKTVDSGIRGGENIEEDSSTPKAKEVGTSHIAVT